MQLSTLETTADSVRAGYECPCGCRPNVTYLRHGTAVYDGCCCGNEFVVGPETEARLAPRPGFRAEAQPIGVPWGVPLQAAWLIGASTHPAAAEHEHETHHRELPMAPAKSQAEALDSALDPVCGMTIDRETARAKGLVSSYEGREYFFCGKGCKLDFEEDPARYFDPAYQPTM